MKRLSAIFLMLIVLVISLTTPVLAAGPSLHSATGGGTVERTVWGTDDTYKNTYAFTVQQLDEAGNAKGNYVVVFNHGTEYHHTKFEVDIKYAYFEGNFVYMSGVITHAYRPQWVGMGLLTVAIDNGEGQGATGPDKVSSILICGRVDAAADEDYRNWNFGNPPYGFDLTNGSVQIK